MKKRFDKEDFLGLLVIIGAIFLICGWITIFVVLPILGIKEALKFLLEVPYDEAFIVFGNIGAISAIGIVCYCLYEYLICSLEEKMSRRKLKKIKEFFGLIICSIITFIAIVIYIILRETTIMMFLAKSIMFLFGLEIVIFAICLLIVTNNYANKKTKFKN